MTNRMTPVVSSWDDGHRSPPVAIDTRAGAIDDALAQWAGSANMGGDVDPLGLSAAQAAIGFYSRAFAMATVEPASLQPTLSPIALASIARLLMSGGNYVAEIGISDSGALELLPCTDYEVAAPTPTLPDGFTNSTTRRHRAATLCGDGLPVAWCISD